MPLSRSWRGAPLSGRVSSKRVPLVNREAPHWTRAPQAPPRHAPISLNLADAVMIVAATLLAPIAVPLLVLVGIAVSLLVQRQTPKRLAFNLAMHLTAATAAAGVAALADPLAPVDPTTAEGLLLLLAVGATYTAVNHVAMFGLLRRLQSPTGVRIGHRSLAIEGLIGMMISVSLGVLLAVALASAPLAALFVLVPFVLTRRVLSVGAERVAAEATERERLERTIAGASEGICLLDRTGTVELLNPAAVTLLDPARKAVGQPLDALLPREAASPVTSALSTCSPEEPRVQKDLELGDRIVSLDVTCLFDRARRTGAVVLLHDVTAAREQESLQREFVARASHELRTPLTAIVGFTETLQTHLAELDPARTQEYLEVIERHGQRLGRLVDDLLWSARLEAGTAAPVPEDVDLQEVVSELRVDLRPMLGDTIVEWEVPPVALRCDRRHLDQILTNLLVNAATYGAPPIRLQAETDGRRGTIEVSDGGAGVRKSFIPRLFSPFTQASVGDRRQARGLGLGLAIVSSLVESNGGDITYDRVDDRTVFRVCLPAAPPPTTDSPG